VPQDNEEGLTPVPPPISLEFEVPEFDRVEVYLVTLEDGTVVTRTKEELKRPRSPEAPEEKG